VKKRSSWSGGIGRGCKEEEGKEVLVGVGLVGSVKRRRVKRFARLNK